MATKRRRPAKRTTTGKKRTQTRRRQAARRRPSAHGARTGAREARREEAARQVEQDTSPRLVTVEGNGARAERAAEREVLGGAGVPRFARQVAEEASARRAEAQAELRRRREQAESAWDRQDVPGLSSIGVELALGAMRLARTLATAPLRIGLAFLRPREA